MAQTDGGNLVNEHNPIVSIVLITILLVLPVLSAHAQFDSQNCSLIGRWAEADCYDVVADGNIVYFGNGAYLQIMDFTDPVNPILLGRIALPLMVRGLAPGKNKMYVANYYADCESSMSPIQPLRWRSVHWNKLALRSMWSSMGAMPMSQPGMPD